MAKPRPPEGQERLRIEILLRPEIMAKLKLACVDLTFGNVIYGEQSRIINEALRQYFERKENVLPGNSVPN